MYRVLRKLVRVVLVAVFFTWMGCNRVDPSQNPSERESGTLRLSLSGVGSSGTEYRLRYALFSITGASVSSFSSEYYLGEAKVELTLKQGAYSIELSSGWILERRSADTYEPVKAELASDNPVAFTIVDQQTTRVSFQFETSGDVIQMGEGALEVSIQVTERAGVRLEPGTAMLVGTQPTNGNSHITTGDVNGDGWPDIAVAHGFATGGLILNRGDETFAPEALISENWWNAQSAIGATTVSLVDLDLDGQLDYVFSIYGDHYVGKAVQLYKGDGNGNHAIPSQLPNGLIYELRGANPIGNQVADFDNNGLPDVAIGSNNGGHTVDLILQTTPWVFTATYAYNQNGQSNPQWIEIGDLNNDGWMDLVVPFLYGTVEVYLNSANSTGAMTYAGGYLSSHHSRVAVADLDGDGSLDIAARSENESHVDILYNDGSGRFTITKSFPVSGPSGTSAGGMVRAGDVNGDGAIDLVVCGTSTSTVDVLLNDGLGSFAAAVPITVDEPPYTMALDDFDLDGDLDVAVYTTLHNVNDHVQVLWNRLD